MELKNKYLCSSLINGKNDENGIIQKIITKVKTKDHTAQILNELGI